MKRKSFSIIILILFCLGPFLLGCPKKTVVKEEPSVKRAEELAAERERAARLEAERALREKELRAKEEEAKRALALKELEAERERAARLEAEKALKEKELKAKEEEAKRALALKELEAERERAARLEAERTLKEKALQELEVKKAQALKELEAERERIARLEAERAAREAKRALAEKEKEFEKSLVARRTPGIEGEVFESHLLKDIHFDFDKYDIRPVDAETLKKNAALLMKHSNVKIQIEGHCDERGTAEYNLALAERRANSTKNYLISLGLSADRISTISYGEERPLDPSHNEEAWAKNRRAYFAILAK